MSTVDNRIVDMQFNNREFERGIQTSIRSLGELEKSLDLKQSARNLASLERAGRTFSMDGMIKCIDNVNHRLSGIGTFGSEMLRNLADDAYTYGKRIAKALNFELTAAKTGFSEYETQINAIQTILANTSSKGTTLDEVTAALDELNAYADKTIYNFTEMTKNVGTFTAAGVKLDTSVEAIKGIANLGAVSGSNSQQVATAMYQLSQALSSGTVKLMDWNSVVNAGMGGEIFQNSLKETARLHGVAIDKMIEEEGSFRETLSTGWLTSDILLETLSKFTGDLTEAELLTMGYTTEQTKEILELGTMANDAATKVKTFTQLFDTLKEAMQSGWTQSWEYIVGDFEEAKSTLTMISDYIGGLIGESANARNRILSDWKELGGRDELVKMLENASAGFDNLREVADGVFEGLFPKMTGDKLYAITQKLSGFTDRFKAFTENAEAMESIRRTLAAIGSIIKGIMSIAGGIRKKIFGAIGGTISGLLEGFDFNGGGIITVLEKIGQAFNTIGEIIANGGLIRTIKKTKEAVGNGLFRAVAKDVEAGAITEEFQKLISVGELVVSCFGKIKDALGRAAKTVWSSVAGVFTALGSIFGKLYDHVDVNGALTKLTDWIVWLIDLTGAGISSIGSFFGGIINWLSDFEGFASVWHKITNFLSAPTESLLTFFKETLPYFFTETIPAFFHKSTDQMVEKLQESKETVVVWFNNLTWVKWLKNAWIGSRISISRLFREIIPQFFTETLPEFFRESVAKATEKLETAKASFTDWFNKSTMVNWIRNAWISTTEAISNFFHVSIPKFFTETIPDLFKRAIDKLRSFGEMIADTEWFKKLSEFVTTTDWEAVTAGIIDMAKTLTTLRLLWNAGGMLYGLGKASKGIGELMGVVGSGSDLRRGLKYLGKGIGSIGESLSDLFKKGLTIKHKQAGTWATNILKIAASIAILAGSLYLITKLDYERVKDGLTIMGVMAAGLVATAILMPKGNSNFGMNALALAAGIAILCIPLKTIAEMDSNSVRKGLIGLGIMLTEIGLFMRLSGTGMLSRQNFIGLAISLLAMTAVVKILANMNTEDATVALVELGVLMIEFGIFTRLAGSNRVSRTAVLAIAAAVGVLGQVIKELGDLTGTQLFKGLGGITLMLIMLGSFMKQANNMQVSAWGAIAAAGSVMLMALAVKQLGELDTGVLGKGLLAIGILMAGMAAILKQGGQTNFGGALVSFAAMAASLWLFTETFKRLDGIDTEKMLQFSTSVAKILWTLSSALKVASSMTWGGALSALGKLMLSIVAIGGFTVALGYLFGDMEEIQTYLSSGSTIMGGIGDAVGSFIGGIFAGFGSMVSIDLPKLGTELSDFMNNLDGFLGGIKGVTAEHSAGAGHLSKLILGISWSEIITALASAFTGEDVISSFCEDIYAIGKALTIYRFAVSGIGSKTAIADTDAAIAVGTALTGLINALPLTGGWWEKIIGIHDASSFSADVETLGAALNKYASSVNGFSSLATKDDLDRANAAAIGLTGIADSLSRTGGTLQDWLGVKDLAKFAWQLPSFALGLRIYAVSIRGFSSIAPTDIDNAQTATDGLVALADKVPREGGVGQLLVGSKSLSAFGNQMPGFAKGLMSYAQSIKGFTDAADPTETTNALSIADQLLTFQNGLTRTDGLWQKIVGQKDMTAFSDGLTAMGTALGGFATNVGNVDQAKAQTAIDVLGLIKTFIGESEETGGLWDRIGTFFSGSKQKSIEAISGTMRRVGEDLGSFATSITGFNADHVTQVSGFFDVIEEFMNGVEGRNVFQRLWDWATGDKTQGVDQYTSALGTMGSSLASFNSGLGSMDVDRLTAATDALGALIGLIQNASTEDGNKAGYLAGALNSFAEAGMASIVSIFSDEESLSGIAGAIDGLALVIEGQAGRFDMSGGLLGATFVAAMINGISGNEEAYRNTVVTLMVNGVGAARALYDSWYWAGHYSGAGIINGLYARVSDAFDAGMSIGNAMLNGARLSLLIHSPSAKFEWVAKQSVLGLAQGSKKYAGIAQDSGSDIGKGFQAAAEAALGNWPELIDESIGMSPVIRPVIDMTDINRGMTLIDGYFGQRAIETSAYAESAIHHRRVNTAQKSSPESNQNVVNAINELKEQFSDLSEAVRNMQLVLDSGTVVGELSDKIDRRLGANAARHGRGN